MEKGKGWGAYDVRIERVSPPFMSAIELMRGEVHLECGK